MAERVDLSEVRDYAISAVTAPSNDPAMVAYCLALCGEVELVRGERDAALERVGVLRVALGDALEGLEDMLPYVPDYFIDKYGHQGYIDRARAALARKREGEVEA